MHKLKNLTPEQVRGLKAKSVTVKITTVYELVDGSEAVDETKFHMAPNMFTLNEKRAVTPEYNPQGDVRALHPAPWTVLTISGICPAQDDWDQSWVPKR